MWIAGMLLTAVIGGGGIVVALLRLIPV